MRFTDFGHQLVEQIEAMGLPMLSLGTHSALGMEGYALLVYAMNQCLQSKQLSICINNSIHSIEKFEGIKGIISFDATGQSHRSLVINTIKDNGTMDFIVQVY